MSALPLLLIGGAALVMMSGKKKNGRGGSTVASDKEAVKVVLQVRGGENPIYPFRDAAQLQEALIAVGQKLPKYGADGKWGNESKAALSKYMGSGGRKYGATPGEVEDAKVLADSLRRLAMEAAQKAGVLGTPKGGMGTRLWCNIVEFDCPPGHECVPIFPMGQEPAGWKDVGICVPMDLVASGHIPKPKDYVPGGFNEIFVNPQTKKVHIGGGWEFGTLQRWIQSKSLYTLGTLRNPGGESIKEDYDYDLTIQKYPDIRWHAAFFARWFDALAKSLGLNVTYKQWRTHDWGTELSRSRWGGAPGDYGELSGHGLRGKALEGIRLEGRFAAHKWEGRILSCPDFHPKLVEIHHGIMGSYTGLKSWAGLGDSTLLMGRWLFARAASLKFTVRYGNQTIRLVDLSQKSEKAYQKIMIFIVDSLCRYQWMSMS